MPPGPLRQRYNGIKESYVSFTSNLRAPIPSTIFSNYILHDQLFGGLGFLRTLDQAKTYEERRKVLGSPPKPTRQMLGATLQMCASRGGDFLRWHFIWSSWDITPENETSAADTEWPDTIGPDGYGSGPFRIWRVVTRTAGRWT